MYLNDFSIIGNPIKIFYGITNLIGNRLFFSNSFLNISMSNGCLLTSIIPIQSFYIINYQICRYFITKINLKKLFNYKLFFIFLLKVD